MLGRFGAPFLCALRGALVPREADVACGGGLTETSPRELRLGDRGLYHAPGSPGVVFWGSGGIGQPSHDVR